jgi:nucleoside-triphosphatase THEP1
MAKRNILITGPPRSGKSTVIEKIVDRVQRPATGFFTREIRQKGRRAGFSIRTLDGREGVLAHKRIKSQWRVGKYGVNITDIESIAVRSIIPSKEDEMIVVDEIGKMECFSRQFRETLIKALDSQNRMIGSIALKGGPFIERIKDREDVQLIEITAQNRDFILDQLVESLKAH